MCLVKQTKENNVAGVNAEISVVGIKEALASLNKIDKKARRAITTDFKNIVDTVISDAQNAVPLGAPISGFERNWTTKSGAHVLPWGMVQDTVVAGVSGKKPKEFGGFVKNLATFYLRFTGPTAVLLDMSGKGKVPTTQGTNMVRGLTSKYGYASRVLYPAYERHKDDVVEKVQTLVDKVMKQVSDELK